jgi:Fe-S oxidoreductase
LELVGFQVIVPHPSLCCGRPLFDFGFLDRAKYQLRRVLLTLRDEIRAGTPIVGLEPSCVAVFRDELLNLFPQDEDAIRLHQHTYLLSEFLQKKAQHFQLPKLYRKAIVHLHCHHASIMKPTDEEAILKRLGLDYEIPNSGCCGMAGSFGFEAEKYDVSVQCAERVLLPTVRAASKDTLIIADGFSCQEQIKQLTDRRGLHLAEVIQMAFKQGSRGPAGNFPERLYAERESATSLTSLAIATTIGVLAIGSAAKWFSWVQHKNSPRRHTNFK